MLHTVQAERTCLEHEVVGGLQVGGRARIAHGGVHVFVVRLGQHDAREQVADDALPQ